MSPVVNSYENAMSPIYLFSAENQEKYRYTLMGKSWVKKMSRNAYVVEVSLKEDHSKVLTVAWIDDLDFSILKFQVYPAGFEGYGLIEGSGLGHLTDLRLWDIHYFGIKNNGVRFPSRTEIFLDFKHKAKKRYGGETYVRDLNTKMHTIYTYQDYMFFNVSVDDPVFVDKKE
jgi:hypothetical protein